MLIAVDGGKDTTKSSVLNGDNLVTNSFRSRLYNVSESGDIPEAGNTHRVVFNGTEWLVGDSGTDQNYSTNKVDEYNKICQYVAITQHIEAGPTQDVELITGFPAVRYKNTEERKEFVDNLKGRVSILVDEQNYSFNINRVRVRPEGSGITVLKPEWFLDKETVVIDIGGQNANIVLFDNLIPTETMITRNAGGVHIEEDISNGLGANGVENPSESFIRTAIKDRKVGNYDNQEELLEIVDSVINRYIKTEILDVLDRNKLTIDNLDVVVIGGSGFVLKNYLEKQIPHAKFLSTLEESQFANVKGFYRLGELSE